jgi:hypothetical protein
MNQHRILLLAGAMLAAGLLSGCTGLPSFGDSKPAAAHSAANRPSSALREGIGLYNEGDFNAAIRRLSAREIASGPVSTRTTALKYTAFSYCVTSRPEQCRNAFDKALRLDPSFDLAPGERGHPLWGPVFSRAKKSRERAD